MRRSIPRARLCFQPAYRRIEAIHGFRQSQNHFGGRQAELLSDLVHASSFPPAPIQQLPLLKGELMHRNLPTSLVGRMATNRFGGPCGGNSRLVARNRRVRRFGRCVGDGLFPGVFQQPFEGSLKITLTQFGKL